MKKVQIKNNLFNSIKSLIEEAKQKITRNVNSVIVYTHFEIGKIIVEDEQQGKERAGYADKTLIQLSADLTAEYGNGYSRSNLEYMRKFYLIYRERISQPAGKSTASKKSQPVVGKLDNSLQLSWSHYIQFHRITTILLLFHRSYSSSHFENIQLLHCKRQTQFLLWFPFVGSGLS